MENIFANFSFSRHNRTETDEGISSEDLLFARLTMATSTTTSVIALSGVITNGLCVNTFIKMGATDGVTFSLLCLAISDVAFTMSILISQISQLCSSMETVFGIWLSRVDPFVIMVFSSNTVAAINVVITMQTAYVALVRCLCVTLPFTFKNIFTRGKCLVFVCVFIMCTIAIHAPYISHMGTQWKWDKNFNVSRLTLWMSPDTSQVKSVAHSVSMNGISSVSQAIIIVSIIIMTSKLKASVRFRRQQEGGSKPENKAKQGLTGKERNVVLQVVFISIVFIACKIFTTIHSLLLLTLPGFALNGSQENMYRIMIQLLSANGCINSSVNFYIYMFFNRRFRSQCFSCIKI